MNFSNIARQYDQKSVIQKAAGERLFDLVNIKGHEDVLDLGCGTGKITRRISKLTIGKVLGIDPSEDMIHEAKKNSDNVEYAIQSAEELDMSNCLDVIICNSAFQWFKSHDTALDNCFRALRNGGRMAIQAPAKKVYSPNFIDAVQQVLNDSRTQETFAAFQSPWFFCESADEYKVLFEKAGFNVAISNLEQDFSLRKPEEVMTIFESASITAYLDQENYSIPLTDTYMNTFKEIVRKAFANQANEQGFIELTFNRIYLLALKATGSDKPMSG